MQTWMRPTKATTMEEVWGTPVNLSESSLFLNVEVYHVVKRSVTELSTADWF